MFSLESPAPALADLSSQLSDLRDALEPLYSSAPSLTSFLELLKGARTKDESGKQAAAGTQLDTARLNVSLAYVILDLVWMHLRLEGIETSGHPVMAELARVKGRFAKIKAAQDAGPDSGTAGVSSSKSAVDGGAAARLVRGALGATPFQPPVHKRFDFEKDEEDTQDVSVAATVQSKDQHVRQGESAVTEGSPSTAAKRKSGGLPLEEASSIGTPTDIAPSTPILSSASEDKAAAKASRKKRRKLRKEAEAA